MRLQTKEVQEFRLQQICILREEGVEQKEIARLTDCRQGWVKSGFGTRQRRRSRESKDGTLVIICDNASIHDCAETPRFLATDERAKRLYLVKQSTYSAKVNADEQVWNQLKVVGLKNTCNRNVKELQPRIVEEMEKLKDKPQLIKKFFHHEDVRYY